MTSALVTRPSRPLPAIDFGSSLLSSTILRAAGIKLLWSESCFAACATGAADRSAAFAAAAAEAAAGSITAMTSPDPAVPPSALTILAMTPSAGAGSSSTTLSVSTSIRFSSRATVSPTFLCQLSSVASATDSESCGTLTSTNMTSPFSFFAAVGYPFGGVLQKQVRVSRPVIILSPSDACCCARDEDTTENCSAQRPAPLIRRRLCLKLAQCRSDQRRLLFQVLGVITDRGRGRRRPAGIQQFLVRAHVLDEIVPRLVPGTLVLRLFLAPHHLDRLRVALDLRRNRLV